MRDRDAAAVGNERTRPAQQMLPKAGEQEPMRGNPICRIEHGQCTSNEVLRRRRIGERGQRDRKRFGVGAKAADPRLPALIGRCQRPYIMRPDLANSLGVGVRVRQR